ncbi:MAG: hypothetical protein V1834_00715 [Candidatus Micrarchaeota archaeon]
MADVIDFELSAVTQLIAAFKKEKERPMASAIRIGQCKKYITELEAIKLNVASGKSMKGDPNVLETFVKIREQAIDFKLTEDIPGAVALKGSYESERLQKPRRSSLLDLFRRARRD